MTLQGLKASFSNSNCSSIVQEFGGSLKPWNLYSWLLSSFAVSNLLAGAHTGSFRVTRSVDTYPQSLMIPSASSLLGSLWGCMHPIESLDALRKWVLAMRKHRRHTIAVVFDCWPSFRLQGHDYLSSSATVSSQTSSKRSGVTRCWN